MGRRFWNAIASAVVLLVLSLSAAAQNFEVKSHTLKNGMKVLVQEDRSIPNVALYVFYRIGSRNEHTGTTGLSHFFEHMMFNGAKKYGPGEFDHTMEAAGGRNNAYTNRDVTVYQDWFPNSALELIFDLEGDRIENLAFDPKIIESERGVVYSERRNSVDASNRGILNEQLMAAAFISHPYQWPVVGWARDIESWKMDDLKHHFAMGYSPNNATMVVVGAVDAEQIFQLAEKYIGSIATHDPPPKIVSTEPDQMGERRVTVRKFAQLPLLSIGYHVPEANSPDYYALDVLETIAFSGQSSRMYRRVVDKDQLALSINGGRGISFDPTLFTISSQPKAGVAPETVEKAIYEEIGRLQNEPISDQDLEKAKNILQANFYRDMKTISGRANAIGTFEVFFGDYHKLFNAIPEYDKVTKADVQRIAKKYFTEKNRTVATLIPEAEAAK